MRSRSMSPVLVGRGGELTDLHREFERAAAGRPSIVLVAGEAGVGKTRLVEDPSASRIPHRSPSSPSAPL